MTNWTNKNTFEQSGKKIQRKWNWKKKYMKFAKEEEIGDCLNQIQFNSIIITK